MKAEELGSGFDPSKVLLPPFLNMEMNQMTIVLTRAQNIKKMDKFGKVDPFVKVKFGLVEFKTKHCKDTYDPIWNQTILVIQNYIGFF